MILATVKNGKNSLCVELPDDELLDHLGSIGVGGDISVSGSEKVKVELEPDEKIPCSAVICERLFPNDRLTDLDMLCDEVGGSWRIQYVDFERALVEKDIHGIDNMLGLFDEMDLAAKDEIEYHKKHDMDCCRTVLYLRRGRR